MKSLLVFLCSFALVFQASAKSNETLKTEASAQTYLYAAEFMNNFETIGEYLNGLHDLTLITQGEYDGIVEILKEKKVPLTEKLTRPTIAGKSISWGKATLISQADGSFKTKDGVFIRINEKESADKTFAKTLKAFENQKYSSVFSLLVPSAQAQAAQSGAIDAALNMFGDHALKVGQTFLDATGGAAANGIGYLWEHAYVQVYNFIYQGKVECDPHSPDKYFVDAGFKYLDWNKVYEEGRLRYDDLKNILGNHSVGYDRDLGGYSHAGLEILYRSYESENNRTKVSAAGLKAAWPDGKIPKCDEKNAALLQAALKKQAQAAEVALASLKKASVSAGKKAPSVKTRN